MGKVADKLKQAAASVESMRTERHYEACIGKLERQLAYSEQRRKHAEHELDTVAAQVDFLKAIGSPSGTVRYRPFKPAKPKGSATAVINLGDWHCEEEVDPATINGKNEFNLKIAEQRIRNTFEGSMEVLRAARALSNIRDLVVGLSGDFITGHIHEEMAETTLLSPIQATMFAQRHIRSGLDYLLEHSECESITVVTSCGNHARTTKKPRIATMARHSFEWLMYHNLAEHYRDNDRIRWKVEEGYHNYLEVQGKIVGFEHGDWIKYQGGVMGLGVPAKKAFAKWNEMVRADFRFFQHWHQYLPDERYCCGGSLIGYNAYAQSIKAEFEQPCQVFAVFDRKRPTPVDLKKIYCN